MNTIVVRIQLVNATQDAIKDTCDNQLAAGNVVVGMAVIGDSLVIVFQPK